MIILDFRDQCIFDFYWSPLCFLWFSLISRIGALGCILHVWETTPSLLTMKSLPRCIVFNIFIDVLLFCMIIIDFKDRCIFDFYWSSLGFLWFWDFLKFWIFFVFGAWSGNFGGRLWGCLGSSQWGVRTLQDWLDLIMMGYMFIRVFFLILFLFF